MLFIEDDLMYTSPYSVLSRVFASDRIMSPLLSTLIRLPIRAGSLKDLVTFTSMLLQKKITAERKLLILIATLLIFFEESKLSLTIGLMVSVWVLMESLGQKECMSVCLVLANIIMYERMKNRIHSHLLIWCLVVTRSIVPTACCRVKAKRQKLFSLFSYGMFLISFLRVGVSLLHQESLEESIIKGCTLFCGMCPCSFVIGRPLVDGYVHSGSLTQSESESILKMLDTWSVLYNSLALLFGSGMFSCAGAVSSPGLSSLAMIHSTAVTYYILWLKLRNKKFVSQIQKHPLDRK